MSTYRKSIDEIVHDDYSILHRCIHALGTGYKLQGAKDMTSARLANLRVSTFAATKKGVLGKVLSLGVARSVELVDVC
jgi:hypothetical protein